MKLDIYNCNGVHQVWLNVVTPTDGIVVATGNNKKTVLKQAIRSLEKIQDKLIKELKK